MLYVEVMYHFNEQVDFKISSKLIQASKGFKLIYQYNISDICSYFCELGYIKCKK